MPSNSKHRFKPIFLIDGINSLQFFRQTIHRRDEIFLHELAYDRGRRVQGPVDPFFVFAQSAAAAAGVSSTKPSLEKDEFDVQILEDCSPEEPFDVKYFSAFLRAHDRELVGGWIGEAAEQGSEVEIGTKATRFRVDEVNL